MKRSTILIATFSIIMHLLNASFIQAQNIKTITLQETIDLSIKNSKQLKASKARITEATANLKEVYESKLPDFSINGSFLYLPITPNINLSGKSDSSGSGPNVSSAMYGIASVSLPIYAGGKLKYGIVSAKYLEQAATLDADNDRDEVVMNSISAFMNLYKAKEAVKLVKENLAQSQQRVKDFTNLEKNGLLARNDLLKAELQSSNIELALLDAENNWKLASVNMNLMIGLPEQTELITDVNDLQQENTIHTIEEYEQTAAQHRKDAAALLLRKKAAEIGIKSVKSDMYPSVAITGGYIAAHIPEFVTITNAVNIGVGVKYNLSSLWKTKAKVQQAEARVLQLQANEEILNNNIHLQINQAYQDYLLSKKRVQVYEKAVEQATENYKINKNKYDNALATTTDLLDADVAALQAKLNYTVAKADAIVTYNKLLQVVGILNN